MPVLVAKKAINLAGSGKYFQQIVRHCVGLQPVSPVADLRSCHGGIMRIGRRIIIPAILTLSVAGSVLAPSELAVTATSAPGVHVQTTVHHAVLDTYLRG